MRAIFIYSFDPQWHPQQEQLQSFPQVHFSSGLPQWGHLDI
jgi:hypothetical protein